MTAPRKPEAVLDWSTDYDMFDPQYLINPFPVLNDIRESECPIAHSEFAASRAANRTRCVR